MSRAWCEHGEHYPERLLLSATPETYDLLLGDNAGNVISWADGTIGVPDNIRALAQEDDSPWCAEHECEITWDHSEEDEPQGISPEGLALGHRYVMGNVNAYCPKCSREQGVTVLDCDYDLDK